MKIALIGSPATHALRLMALLMVLCSATGQAQTSATSARALLSRMSQAYSAKDTQQLGAVFSDDAKISVKVFDQGKPHVFTPSKVTHLRDLAAGWKLAQHHKLTFQVRDIKDVQGKVIAKIEVKESLLQQGRFYNNATYSDLTIETINGKPLITAMQSNFSSLVRK